MMQRTLIHTRRVDRIDVALKISGFTEPFRGLAAVNWHFVRFDPVLDRDFPRSHHADERRVGGLGDQIPRWPGKTRYR